MQRIIFLNKRSSSSSQAIYMLFRMYDMDKASHAHLFESYLKLGELEVLSTKNFFKIYEKSKSRTIEKMVVCAFSQ